MTFVILKIAFDYKIKSLKSFSLYTSNQIFIDFEFALKILFVYSFFL